MKVDWFLEALYNIVFGLNDRTKIDLNLNIK